MKKIVSIMIILILSLGLAACQPREGGEEEGQLPGQQEHAQDLALGAMTGPTGAGVVHLLADPAFQVDLSLSSTPEDLIAGLAKGDLDAAVIPLNMAVKLYDQGLPIQVLASNNLGVVYGLTKEEKSLEEFLGQPLASTGKGATPEVLLQGLAHYYGLADQLQVDYVQDPAELVQRALQGGIQNLVLPEPMVTKLLQAQPDWQVLDFNQAWAEAFDGSQIITAVLVVQKDYPEKQALQEAFVASVQATDQVEETARLAGQAKIFDEEVLKEALARIPFEALTGEELKSQVLAYLSLLQEQAPDLAGASLPGSDFFYE